MDETSTPASRLSLPAWLRWNRTSYALMSAFLLIIGLIMWVWYPLVEEYIALFNPAIPLWRQLDWLLLGILQAIHSHCVAEGVNQRAVAVRQQNVYLDHALWQSVLDFIETLPQVAQREKQHYERVRWLFRFLYGVSLRASEAAQAKSNDLVQKRGKWWLHVVGKGNIEGDVPVSDELMTDLARYRQFHGLSSVPTPFEVTPLVLTVTGRPDKFLTPTAIYLIVKEIFRRAADAIGETNPGNAATLRRASTHWLRHTSATHQADAGNDIRFIQKNLRHASIETTAIYLHAEDDQRHAQTTK